MSSVNIWELAKEKLRENQEKALEIDEKLEDEGTPSGKFQANFQSVRFSK